jgi:alpha-galactosidase
VIRCLGPFRHPSWLQISTQIITLFLFLPVHSDIDDDLIKRHIDLLVARNRTVDGQNMSLCDVGYCSLGIDEGWEGCGLGVNGTQHDAHGFPVANAKFPNLKSLVDYGHAAGVAMGWYLNGCACGEKEELLINYQGDVQKLHEYGFDRYLPCEACQPATINLNTCDSLLQCQD